MCAVSCCVHGRSSQGCCISRVDAPQYASRSTWQVCYHHSGLSSEDIPCVQLKQRLKFNVVDFITCSSSEARESLIYSYGKSFNGFVAKLSDKEVARIKGNHVLMLHVMSAFHTHVSEFVSQKWREWFQCSLMPNCKCTLQDHGISWASLNLIPGCLLKEMLLLGC